MTIYATNAAKEPHALYADLHEKAEHCITGGPRASTRFFATVWAAPFELDPGAPETWRIANPLIGTTIEESKVAEKWKDAQGSPDAEQVFRLQYLGQPVRETSRWLNLDRWDACTDAFEADKLADAPLYCALDMSSRDDLCAFTEIYTTPTKFYVQGRAWMPKATADAYQAKDPLITYREWQAAGLLKLLPQRTIDTTAHDLIAAEIIELHKRHPITMLCYDSAYSGHVIETLKAAGIKCEKIRQGWSLSPGCEELDRRLLDGSIQLQANALMRWCADNVEVKHDHQGNYWPVKPDATKHSTGKRSKKIDPIQALVTGLTKAREHDFPKAAAAEVGAMVLDWAF